MTVLIANKRADRPILARSFNIVTPADDIYDIISLPKMAFVTNLWLYISTAFTAAGATLNIGWQGNAETAVTDGFMTNQVSKPTITGMKAALIEDAVTEIPKYFSTQRGMITVTTDDNAGTAGTFMVFCVFYVLH